MGFFEIGRVGFPCALLGAAYLLTVGRKLLPDRKELIEQLEETRREYLVEMLVQPGCRLAGKTIGEAGLRHLPGLFLIEIDRDGEVIGPVGPDEAIQANDRLVFTGVVSTIVDLEKIPGLVPAADARYEVSPAMQRGRQLCEAVISPSSPLVGQAVRDADFRVLYDAAIVAVHRNGARLTNKVGDIRLHAGDTLLLQVGPNFSRAFRNNPDFYLVSDVEDSSPVRYDRARPAAIIFLAMIAAFVSGKVDIMLAAMLAAGAMVALPLRLGHPGAEVGRPAGADRHRRVVRRRQGAGAVGRGRAVRRAAGRGDAILGADRDPGGHLLRHHGAQRADQQQRRRGAGVPLLRGVGPAAGRQPAAVHHGRDAGRLVRLRLADRLPDAHDGLRARRLSLHRLPRASASR